MKLIFFTVALVFFFVHLPDLWGIIKRIYDVLAPILYGLLLAYVLNNPYRFFRERAFSKMGTKRKWLAKLRKPLALVVSYVIVFGLIIVLFSILIPEVTNSIRMLIDNIPSYAQTIREASEDVAKFVLEKTGYDLHASGIIDSITGSSAEAFVTRFLTNTVPSAALDFGYTMYNWILGFIISIYLLSSKETLLRQFKRLIVAYTPDKFHNYLFKVADVMNFKCGKFIIGRLIDSIIIGFMCFIGMTIFNFHYAPLISFIIGLSNMIPFFGPFIGAIPSAFLLLIVDPMEAVWFLVFDIILQQFDGNILGPKVLGESVGISGFWIMVSVIVSGGLFGIPGMLLGVPVFAAVLTLLSEGVDGRLKRKKMKAKAAAAEGASDIAEMTEVPDPPEPSESLESAAQPDAPSEDTQ